LLHETKSIGAFPAFRNFAINDSDDVDTPDIHGEIGWWNATEVASEGPGHGVAERHPIAISDYVVNS
jgi:hypothetical protein